MLYLLMYLSFSVCAESTELNTPCESYTSCKTCASTSYACGWCYDNMQCLNRSSPYGSTCRNTISWYGGCDDCLQFTTCRDCSASGKCGWRYGAGLYYSSCSSTYSKTLCCENRTSCTACLSKSVGATGSDCSWCRDSSTCQVAVPSSTDMPLKCANLTKPCVVKADSTDMWLNSINSVWAIAGSAAVGALLLGIIFVFINDDGGAKWCWKMTKLAGTVGLLAMLILGPLFSLVFIVEWAYKNYVLAAIIGGSLIVAFGLFKFVSTRKVVKKWIHEKSQNIAKTVGGSSNMILIIRCLLVLSLVVTLGGLFHSLQVVGNIKSSWCCVPRDCNAYEWTGFDPKAVLSQQGICTPPSALPNTPTCEYGGDACAWSKNMCFTKVSFTQAALRNCTNTFSQCGKGSEYCGDLASIVSEKCIKEPDSKITSSWWFPMIAATVYSVINTFTIFLKFLPNCADNCGILTKIGTSLNRYPRLSMVFGILSQLVSITMYFSMQGFLDTGREIQNGCDGLGLSQMVVTSNLEVLQTGMLCTVIATTVEQLLKLFLKAFEEVEADESEPTSLNDAPFSTDAAAKWINPSEWMSQKDPAPSKGDEGGLVGWFVEVYGLSTRPELNGRVGIVSSYIPDTGRYEVRIDGIETVALKPSNLRSSGARAPPSGHSPLPPPQYGSGPTQYAAPAQGYGYGYAPPQYAYAPQGAYTS